MVCFFGVIVFFHACDYDKCYFFQLLVDIRTAEGENDDLTYE